MLRTIILTTALCVVFAWAANPDCPPADILPAITVAPGGPADADIAPTGTSRVHNPDEIDWSTVGPGGRELVEEESSATLPLFPDWGDDQLIIELSDNPTFGKLSADVAPNGDIYVAILKPTSDPAHDSVHVYRSTTGGTSWEHFGQSYSPTGATRDMVLRVGSDANGTWIYSFLVISEDLGGLFVRRQREDYGSSTWRQIIVGDSIMRVTADRNTHSPQHLFAAWEDAAGRIHMVSSSDSAQTWGNMRYIASEARRPAVAAGGDGYVYITFLYRDDSTRFRVARYTKNLIDPAFKFSTIDSNPDFRHREVSIAAGRTTPGSEQTAIVFHTYRYAPNDNHGPRYAWTNDGGETWSSSFWPPTNIARETWRARGPYIRRSYDDILFRGIVTMPEATTNFDTLVYAFTRPADPTEWEGREVPNDHRISGEFGGQVDASSKSDGGFIVYREYAGPRVWFDGWNWTDLEEGPDRKLVPGQVSLPFGRNEIRLSLQQPAPVKAVLYDGVGRQLTVIHDGLLDSGEHRLPVLTEGIARGIYFVNIEVNGTRQIGKLVLTD